MLVIYLSEFELSYQEWRKIRRARKLKQANKHAYMYNITLETLDELWWSTFH
jgi:DNA-binding transcriptional regulator YiaG